MIYSANQINSTKPIVLKFKEEINAIITLGWGTAPNLDVIGIGSSESIQVYNAFENVSIFYKKIDDGLRYVVYKCLLYCSVTFVTSVEDDLGDALLHVSISMIGCHGNDIFSVL